MATPLAGPSPPLRQRSSAAGFPGGFTILMAVYGRDDARLFVRAVESVYANTVAPDDFVLVVDGPVPEPLRDAIGRLETVGRVRPIWLPENRGLASALNRGLEEVRTEWVVRADADDVNVRDRFERQAAAIRRASGGLDLLGGAIMEIDGSGSPLAVREVPRSAGAIARRLAFRNPFNHMTVAYRASLARAVGGYPDIHLKEDYGLWATLIARGARCANLDDVLVHATAGAPMHRRRGGLPHATSELGLQLYLHRLGHTGLTTALFIGLARAAVSCLPAAVRGWIYDSLLRRRRRPA